MTKHDLDEHASFWFWDANGSETYACICTCGARLNIANSSGDEWAAQIGEADRWLDNGHLHEPGRLTDIYL